MPYTNVPEELWDKMDSCVRQVQEGQPDLDKPSAVAICYESVVGKVALSDLLKVDGSARAYLAKKAALLGVAWEPAPPLEERIAKINPKLTTRIRNFMRIARGADAAQADLALVRTALSDVEASTEGLWDGFFRLAYNRPDLDPALSDEAREIARDIRTYEKVAGIDKARTPGLPNNPKMRADLEALVAEIGTAESKGQTYDAAQLARNLFDKYRLEGRAVADLLLEVERMLQGGDGDTNWAKQKVQRVIDSIGKAAGMSKADDPQLARNTIRLGAAAIQRSLRGDRVELKQFPGQLAIYVYNSALYNHPMTRLGDPYLSPGAEAKAEAAVKQAFGAFFEYRVSEVRADREGIMTILVDVPSLKAAGMGKAMTAQPLPSGVKPSLQAIRADIRRVLAPIVDLSRSHRSDYVLAPGQRYAVGQTHTDTSVKVSGEEYTRKDGTQGFSGYVEKLQGKAKEAGAALEQRGYGVEVIGPSLLRWEVFSSTEKTTRAQINKAVRSGYAREFLEIIKDEDWGSAKKYISELQRAGYTGQSVRMLLSAINEGDRWKAEDRWEAMIKEYPELGDYAPGEGPEGNR